MLLPCHAAARLHERLRVIQVLRANLPPDACIGLMGSHGAVIWGHGGRCYEDIIEQSC
jgi:hypothetical protein